MATTPKPLPPSNFPWVDKVGKPQQSFLQWASSLDAALRAFFGATTASNAAGAPQVGPLVNAVNDAAAAGAGVPVNGLYHNAGAVRIRLV